MPRSWMLRIAGLPLILLGTGQCGLFSSHAPPPEEILRDNDARDLERGLALKGKDGQYELARAYLRALRDRCAQSFRVHRALQDLILDAGPQGEADLKRERYDQLPEDTALHLALKARVEPRVEVQRTLLERALEKDDRFVWALLGLAFLERRTDNLEAARDDLLRVLDAWNGFPEALRDLAEVDDALGDYEDARTAYERYLALETADRDARFDYGVLLWSALGRAQEADAQFEHLLRQNPNDLDALAWHANMLTYERRYTEAIALYQQVLSADPKRPNIYYNLGWIYEALGDVATARDYYVKFLNADVGDADTRSVFDVLFFVPNRIPAVGG